MAVGPGEPSALGCCADPCTPTSCLLTRALLAHPPQDEAVLAAKMDGVVGILQKANQLPTNEEGEVELDLRCAALRCACCACCTCCACCAMPH